MVILKQGNADAALKPKRFLCQRFGCYFEANRNEYNEWNQIEPLCWCKCPCCGASVYEQR